MSAGAARPLTFKTYVFVHSRTRVHLVRKLAAAMAQRHRLYADSPEPVSVQQLLALGDVQLLGLLEREIWGGDG